MTSCSVRVMGRFRPFNNMEKEAGENRVTIDIVDNQRVDLVTHTYSRHTFTFDRIFKWDVDQAEVYQETAGPTVACVSLSFHLLPLLLLLPLLFLAAAAVFLLPFRSCVVFFLCCFSSPVLSCFPFC